MGANIICVTSSGGLPIFSRKIGTIETFPFSIVGSLNGVHMFGKPLGMEVLNTNSAKYTVAWKEYENSLILIAISYKKNDEFLFEIMHEIYNAMVLIVGIGDVRNVKNPERLKRELRAVYPFVDEALRCLDLSDSVESTSHNLYKYVETVLCRDRKTLQETLESFAETLATEFGCLTVSGRIAVATAEWWQLSPLERKLLSSVMRVNLDCTAFDVPVYLPMRSPSVPFRLIGVCLVNTVWIQMLCGPSPDLLAFQTFSFQTWSPLLPALKTLADGVPRNIPLEIDLHNSIVSFLLIGLTVGKCLFSATGKKENKSSAEILKTFYYQAANSLGASDSSHQPVETYWSAEYHKLHALKKGQNLICILYKPSIPVHTMRLISEDTLRFMTEEDTGWLT